jgi:hypothetical protein
MAVQWMMRLQAAAFGGTLHCVGWCCWGRGSRVRHGGGGGERRWCNGPRGGCGLQRLATMQWCDGRCSQGRGGGATDEGGRCSGVFVFYLHMGMGEIHWREEVDPIIIRLKDRDIIFLCKRYFYLGEPSGYPAQSGLTWRNRQVTQHNQD